MSRIADSFRNPASIRLSITSTRFSLSLQALVPLPIPSESTMTSSPVESSINEKLSPDTFSPLFATLASPVSALNAVSWTNATASYSFGITFLTYLPGIIRMSSALSSAPDTSFFVMQAFPLAFAIKQISRFSFRSFLKERFFTWIPSERRENSTFFFVSTGTSAVWFNSIVNCFNASAISSIWFAIASRLSAILFRQLKFILAIAIRSLIFSIYSSRRRQRLQNFSFIVSVSTTPCSLAAASIFLIFSYVSS